MCEHWWMFDDERHVARCMNCGIQVGYDQAEEYGFASEERGPGNEIARVLAPEQWPGWWDKDRRQDEDGLPPQ